MTIEWYALSFIDILGQANALKQLNDESLSPDEVKKIIDNTYGKVKKFREVFSKTFAVVIKRSLGDGDLDSNELKSDSFSDLIIHYVSLKTEQKQLPLKGIYTLMLATGGSFLQMLSDGIFVRGAIEIGRGIEHQISGSNELYGSALSNAYQLEQQAGYPRIVIGEKLYKHLVGVADAKPNSKKEEINVGYAKSCLSMIVQDCDEQYVLNYLSKEFPQYEACIEKAYEHIKVEANRIFDKETLCSKIMRYGFFWRKHNTLVTRYKDFLSFFDKYRYYKS
jgi:hypothetical protein